MPARHLSLSFSSSWRKIFLFLSFLLHRALALGIGPLAAVTPVWDSEGLLQMFRPVAVTPSCRAWQGMNTGRGGGTCLAARC